jgi:hypothetical protein
MMTVQVKRILLAALLCGVLAGAVMGDERWAPVKAANDIAGSWEGFLALPMSGEGEIGGGGSVVGCTLFMLYIRNGATITIRMKMDMESLLEDALLSLGGEAEGVDESVKDFFWSIMAGSFAESEEVTDVGKYYVTMTFDEGVKSGILDDMFISQDRTKLRVSMLNLVGDSGKESEFILARR